MLLLGQKKNVIDEEETDRSRERRESPSRRRAWASRMIPSRRVISRQVKIPSNKEKRGSFERGNQDFKHPSGGGRELIRQLNQFSVILWSHENAAARPTSAKKNLAIKGEGVVGREIPSRRERGGRGRS